MSELLLPVEITMEGSSCIGADKHLYEERSPECPLDGKTRCFYNTSSEGIGCCPHRGDIQRILRTEFVECELAEGR